MAQLERAQCRIELGDSLWDVDLPEDYQRLLREQPGWA
jgi:hypothetical protein